MNSSERVSSSLSIANVRAIASAAEVAVLGGTPFSIYLTIDWEKMGITSSFQAKIGRFLKLFGDYFRRKYKVPRVYLWVLESKPHVGVHCHILLHLPWHLLPEFKKRRLKWIKACGAKVVRGGAKYEAISYPTESAFSLYAQTEETQRHLRSVDTIVCYMVKGVDRRTFYRVLQLDSILDDAWSPQGTIQGKRVGFSQSLGTRTRRSQVRQMVTPYGTRLTSQMIFSHLPRSEAAWWTKAHEGRIQPLRSNSSDPQAFGRSDRSTERPGKPKARNRRAIGVNKSVHQRKTGASSSPASRKRN